MEDKDIIFEKWPNWLRWIAFIPAGIVGYLLFRLIGLISASFMGYDPSAPIFKLTVEYLGIAGFLFITYYCVPKVKEIITGVFSLIFSIIFLLLVILSIAYGTWFTWDFFIVLGEFIGCLIASILLFIEHGKNSIIKYDGTTNNYSEE